MLVPCCTCSLLKKWYRDEVWLGFLLPFLPRWLLRSRWFLRRCILGLTHVSQFFLGLGNGKAFMDTQCSYSPFKARLKTQEHVLGLVNLIATLSSDHKKNLPGQSRLLEGVFLPLGRGFTVEASWVGGCFVWGFHACCGMMVKFSTPTYSAMATFRSHSPLRIL